MAEKKEKLVFITSRFPYPLEKGDKLRVFYQLEGLARRFEVHLIAINEGNPSEEDISKVAPFCKSISVFNLNVFQRFIGLLCSFFLAAPLQVSYFYNPFTALKIRNLIQKLDPEYLHCHLIRTTLYVPKNYKGSVSVDLMDAFGVGMTKRLRTTKNPLKKLLFAYEEKLVYSYERRITEKYNNLCIISDQDKQTIKTEAREKIKIVRNGVDFGQYFPRNEEKQFDIVFMGNLSYPPNIEAITFVAEKVMPLLRVRKSGIKFLITGANAPQKIKSLLSEEISLLENVPDISNSLAISKIMLAPMFISIGLQNKIIQAMAMKIPCIITPGSNNAIQANPGKEVLEAYTAEEFCDAVILLLNDPKLAEEIAENAFDFVQKNYTWQQVNADLICCIEG